MSSVEASIAGLEMTFLAKTNGNSLIELVSRNAVVIERRRDDVVRAVAVKIIRPDLQRANLRCHRH